MKVDNMRSTASPLRFKVAGLDCQNEIRALRAAVGPIVGGDDKLSFDTKAGLMEVAVGDPNLVIDIPKAADTPGMGAHFLPARAPNSAYALLFNIRGLNCKHDDHTHKH